MGEGSEACQGRLGERLDNWSTLPPQPPPLCPWSGQPPPPSPLRPTIQDLVASTPRGAPSHDCGEAMRQPLSPAWGRQSPGRASPPYIAAQAPALPPASRANKPSCGRPHSPGPGAGAHLSEAQHLRPAVSSGPAGPTPPRTSFPSQPSSPRLPSGPAALNSHGCTDFSR